MKFYDKVKVEIAAGKGGDGIVSGRREKYVAYGGPAGGDGGAGGSIIFVGSKDKNTLIDYKYKKHYKAQPGQPGMSKDKNGKSGENLYLPVPLGTVIKDTNTGQILAQLLQESQEYMAARGGKGGVGNIHFKTSSRQYPIFALLGEPGEVREVVLELQMLGDVALIGAPSVGKSSLINIAADMKVKTADYPFTTLVPNLGVVKKGDYSFSMVDIPGLISGAARGKGLGNDFLRHILKAKTFVFMLDMSKYEQGINDFPELYDELIEYIKLRFQGSTEFGDIIQSVEFRIKQDLKKDTIILEVLVKKAGKKEVLLRKMLYFIINKYDLINDEEILSEYKNHFKQQAKKTLGKVCGKRVLRNTSIISAATGYGVDEGIHNLSNKIKDFHEKSLVYIQGVDIAKKQKNYIMDVTDTEIPKLVSQEYIDETQAKYCKVREVYDPELAYLVYVLPWGNAQAQEWFWSTLDRKAHTKTLTKAGAVKGDIIKIVCPYAGHEDRYIMRD